MLRKYKTANTGSILIKDQFPTLRVDAVEAVHRNRHITVFARARSLK